MRSFNARAELVAALAREGDPHGAPPSQAHRVLGAALLDLIEDRTPEEANALLEAIRQLGQRFPRPLGYRKGNR